MLVLNRIPLRSLRAVEAVARLGSVTAAAQELAVTPGAVSQQITLAEKVLGFALFERHAKGMSVAPRGAEVCALLTDGFARLAQAVSLAGQTRGEVLTVSVAPMFAARWLIWRLPEFHAANPALKVRLDAGAELLEPGRDGVDLCVRVGRGAWPGVAVERLFPQVIFPVCSPAMAACLTQPADLLRFPIIREPRPNFGWEDWLAPGEPEAGALPEGPVFSDASLCLDAAISGSGIFLTFETLAADPLAQGRLAEPFGRRRATRNGYWLVTPKAGRLPKPCGIFRSWLKAQIAAAGFGLEREAGGPGGGAAPAV